MEAHATLTKLIHKHPLASSLITMVRHGIALWIFKFDVVSVSNIIIAVKHRLEFALGAIQLITSENCATSTLKAPSKSSRIMFGNAAISIFQAPSMEATQSQSTMTRLQSTVTMYASAGWRETALAV